MKNRFAVSKILPTLFAIFLSTSIASCSSSEKDEWQIGKDKNSNVIAKIVSYNKQKVLRIRGEGSMKNFASKEEVPWYKYSEEIKDVDISRGLRVIGENAFASLNIEYLVVPDSITLIKNNATNEGVDIYAFDDEIELNMGYEANLYLYDEEIPTSNDIYWQSDESSGDIFKNLSEVQTTYKKTWAYDEEDIPFKRDRIRTLFIGNSFTYRNGRVAYSSGVPGIYDKVTEDLGLFTETFSVTGPGWYLDGHANSNDTCGKQIDKLLNAIDDLDYVVLQEQSVNPFENYTRFLNGVKSLKQKIQSTQKHAKIYLYETWGSPYSANERSITVPAMEAKLKEAYIKAAKECDLNVSFIGSAFTYIYENYSNINLYDTDNRHQGYIGAYLSGCTHACNMLGVDVRETKFEGESKYSAPQLSEEVLEILRNTAYEITQNVSIDDLDDEGGEQEPNNSTTTPSQEDQTKILKIACWGRFMKQAKFNELVDDYKEYATANNISYDQVIGNYFTGPNTSDPYYYIADFSSKLVAEGNYDIVLPCATNFNTNQTNITAIDMFAINVYGQTGRQVGKFNNDDLTNSFMTYCATSRASSIFEKVD